MNLDKRFGTSLSSGRKLITRQRRLGTFEILEVRLALSADSIDGRPYIDLGPSDNVALDQPKVVMELIQLSDSVPIGDAPTFLLDTGANTILTFQTVVEEWNFAPPPYRTDGFFEEIGVGGSSVYDISIPYQIDYAGNSGVRNTIPSGRIISDATRDLSQFGPFGITGMPAMTERVTTLDFTPLLTGYENPEHIGMETDFSPTLPTYIGPRYSIAVDNRVSFNPEGSVISGSPPVWAHLPFLTGQLKQDSLVATGDFLFDTGAQVSIISTAMAMQLGLDSNLDGVLDSKDANYARDETIGGIGGLETVPVFLVDQLHVPTKQGTDLVWTDLQLLILDIIPEIDAIFGFDNMTSGWIEPFFYLTGVPGYIMQAQLDFRNWKATNSGTIYLDLNSENSSVVNPNGPGAIVVESGGTTTTAEGGANDSYTIALSRPPAANVRVNLVPAMGAQVTAYSALNPSNTFIDFTPSNWNIPQTVVVSAVNDSAIEGFLRSFVKNVSSSTDPQYQNVGMPRVIVNVIDNDSPGVMIIPTVGSTNVVEGGATDSYQIVLTYPPTQPVTIAMENRQNQVTAVATAGGGTSLVFTPTNWNVPQSVTVTAVDDSINEGSHKTFISHSISTADTVFQENAFALQETVFITDNDSGDTVAPQIVDVIVGSFDWSAAFIDTVDGGGAGAGNKLGISLPGASQLTNLSQSNLNKIYIKFSENVGSGFDIGKFQLAGTNRSNYMSIASIAYGVDGANVVTIALSSPIGKDALVLSVLDTMIDNAGNRLDGEWVDGVSTSSGNGTSRGRFNFRIDVLPGDVDDSGGVNSTDLLKTNSKNGTVVASRSDAVFDINGNGAVNSTDLLLVNSLNGSTLPNPPIVPSSSLGSSKDGKFNGTSLMGLTVGNDSGKTPLEVLIERRQKQLSLSNTLNSSQPDNLLDEPMDFALVVDPIAADSVFKAIMPTYLGNGPQETRFLDETVIPFPSYLLRKPEFSSMLEGSDQQLQKPKPSEIHAMGAAISRPQKDKREFFADQLISEIAKELEDTGLIRSVRLQLMHPSDGSIHEIL